MDIYQIKYVLKVLECGSFTQAAEALHITQPTLSQQIMKVEEELGVKLFDRNTRSVCATHAGLIFEKCGKDVLTSHKKLLNNLDSFRKTDKKTLRVGFFPTFAKVGQSENLERFFHENNGIKLELQEGFSENLFELLLYNKIDVAILNKRAIRERAKNNTICYFPLIFDRIYLLCNDNSPLSKKKYVTLDEACAFPIIKLPEKTSISKIMKESFKKAGLNPHYICECTDTNNMISLVNSGFGISFLSKRVAESYGTDKTRCVKISPKISNITTLAILQKNFDSEIIKNFVSYMMEGAGREGAW